MKKSIFLVIVLILYGFSAQAAELKIGYVEMQTIIVESNQGKEASKILAGIRSAKNALIKEKEKEIIKLEEELTKQGSILNPETKQKKQAEYERLMMEYKRMRRDRDEELRKNETELAQKIFLNVRKLLKKIAEEEGYTAILNESGIAYMSDKFDLTDRVMKQFNELSKKDEPKK
jgi:outer membrane protein